MQNGQTLRHPKCKGDASTKGGMVEGAHPLLGVSLTLTLTLTVTLTLIGSSLPQAHKGHKGCNSTPYIKVHTSLLP